MLHTNRHSTHFYLSVAPIDETLRLSQEILNLLGLSIVELAHLGEAARWDLRR